MYDKQKWIENKIKTKNTAKHARNIHRSNFIMRHYLGFLCDTCLHGLVKSCVDNLVNGCEYHFNAETRKSFLDLTGYELRKRVKKHRRRSLFETFILFFSCISGSMCYILYRGVA